MTDFAALALNPSAFDTELAARHLAYAKAVAEGDRLVQRAHAAAKDTKRWVGRRQVWNNTEINVLTILRGIVAGDVPATAFEVRNAKQILDGIDAAIETYKAERRAIDVMDAYYTGWSRFILCTSPGGHVHRETGCSSLRFDTPTEWHPELSGLSATEAVDLLDTGLCSKCYPSAPVAIREGYVSRRSQAEAAQRDAEKAARNAAKALKTLSQDETNAFGELGFMRRSELPTTVAALKALVREPADTAACLALYRDETWQARALGNGWTQADLDRRIENQASEMEHDELAAKLAVEILARREADMPGSGQTTEASAKARKTADKNKLREYMAANH